MGGNTGGNDCVHVLDVRAPGFSYLDLRSMIGRSIELRDDTDVVIHDEHGNVCQYTYREFYDHVIAVKSGAYDGIAMNGVPEDVVVPAAVAHGNAEHLPYRGPIYVCGPNAQKHGHRTQEAATECARAEKRLKGNLFS